MGTASAIRVAIGAEVAGLNAEALASPSDRASEGSSSSLTADALGPTERRASGV